MRISFHGRIVAFQRQSLDGDILLRFSGHIMEGLKQLLINGYYSRMSFEEISNYRFLGTVAM